MRLPPLRLWGVIGAGALLSGCASFTAQPLSADDIKTQVQADRQTLARDVAPVSGPVPLEEAIARAIKYNAGQRLRAMEEAVAQGTYDVSTFDMLPKLVASAGYRYRDKDLITRSTDSVTGQPSLAHPYISTDRDYTQSALTLSWSLLDFGQSYYAARQNADRVRIAAERRRKAIYTLVQDVRTAYWRVVASQALESSLRSARDQAEKRWPTPARPRPSSCARRWSRCATSASCWRTCACWKPSRKNCRRPASSWRR